MTGPLPQPPDQSCSAPQPPEVCTFALDHRLMLGSFLAHLVLSGLCQHWAIWWTRGDFHVREGLLGRGLEQMVVITGANV